jgi:hypothetical protein
VIEALASLKRRCTVAIYTDSEYVRNGITTWIHGWKKRGWPRPTSKPVKNAELWQRLDGWREQHDVTVALGQGPRRRPRQRTCRRAGQPRGGVGPRLRWAGPPSPGRANPKSRRRPRRTDTFSRLSRRGSNGVEEDSHDRGGARHRGGRHGRVVVAEPRQRSGHRGGRREAAGARRSRRTGRARWARWSSDRRGLECTGRHDHRRRAGRRARCVRRRA